TVPSKPTVTLQPSWTQIYSGETVTVRCEIQGGEGAQWTYEWRAAKLKTPPTSNEHRIIRATESDSGGYSCRGRRDYFFSEWSDIITLTVSYKPKAKLRADNTTVPVGGSVTLTCSVNPSSSSGWKYYWYRENTTVDVVSPSNGQISVSQEGLYRCRGGRGNPVYYTEDSQEVHINKTVTVSGADSSSSPVWLMVGLVCGVSLIIILLLLLYRCRQSKCKSLFFSCCITEFIYYTHFNYSHIYMYSDLMTQNKNGTIHMTNMCNNICLFHRFLLHQVGKILFIIILNKHQLLLSLLCLFHVSGRSSLRVTVRAPPQIMESTRMKLMCTTLFILVST
uniref:Ig-like domain-containing protein n=1 Tax=Oreochromis niloticus TaxID=8128 RepID=A0A669DKP5_ORENI